MKLYSNGADLSREIALLQCCKLLFKYRGVHLRRLVGSFILALLAGFTAWLLAARTESFLYLAGGCFFGEVEAPKV